MKKLLISILVVIVSACAVQDPVQQSRKALVKNKYSIQDDVEKNTKDIAENADDIDKTFIYYQRLENRINQNEARINSLQRQLDSLLIEKPKPDEFKIYGFAKETTGGKGGDTIRVTNTNDSGVGSLRDALLLNKDRVIISEVSETINLKSNIYVKKGNLTLLGNGLMVRGGMVQFEDSNVIVRYVRFRDSSTDCVSLTAWSGRHIGNFVFDHCSFSNGGDESFDIRGVGSGTVKNVTVQNCIISNSSYAFLSGVGTYNVSVYRNLFAENRERNIRANYPTGNFDFEFINNIVHGFRVGTKPSMGIRFSVINNEYKLKTGFTPINEAVVDASSSGGGVTSNTYAYIVGNIKPASLKINDSALEPYLKDTPYKSSGIVPIPASQLETILEDVGCSLPKRDALDERLINDY